MDERPWYVGNADDDAGENRSWLVGHFKPAVDIRHSLDVEVKWSIHPAGDARGEWNCTNHTRTVLLLVSGSWTLTLRTNGAVQTLPLTRPGDYAVWGSGVDHTWQAVEDSVMVTVRWPSAP